MKITIEADIKGEEFPPEVHERVINMGLVLAKETKFMPETHSRVHINGPDCLWEMLGRLELVKQGLLGNGLRNDKG